MTLRPGDSLWTLLAGGEPDRMPFSPDIGALPGVSDPLLRRFTEETGSVDPAEYFGGDYRIFSLKTVRGQAEPAPASAHGGPTITLDEWGIGHAPAPVEGGVGQSFPPLAEATSIRQIEDYPCPIIVTDFDPAPLHAFDRRGYPVFGYAGSIYEWSWWLRGMEAFLADLVLEPALAEAVIAKVAAYTARLAEASGRAGIDVLCFYDDVGTQTGMQISPDMWRRFIRPQWASILDDLRRRFPAVRTFLHSCGRIEAIIPDIVDLGFDMLHPLQPECMDFAEIHRRFGRHIALCATLSSQRLFPFGSPGDVRREVRRLKAICRADRRAMLCPSNVIQPETPWDNVLAFAEEARDGD